MATTSPPPGWGEDALAVHLDGAYQNSFASYVQLPEHYAHRPRYRDPLCETSAFSRPRSPPRIFVML